MRDSLLMQKARDFSWIVWETTVMDMLGCIKRDISSWADLILDENTHVEVKCRLYGQAVNILIEQLWSLRKTDIYSFVFYKTLSGKRPYWVLNDIQFKDGLFEEFLNSIVISKIFHFPAPYVKRFYETTHMKESRISSSWLKHKWLSVASAERIFNCSDEQKSIFKTPIVSPLSISTLTYAVGEKINLILKGKGFEKI
jgi:hypothetical protein